MVDLYPFAKHALFALDAETAHNFTLKALKTGLVPGAKATSDERLSQSLWGLKFRNPVGLSAGFDKNAEVIAPMLGFGFGCVEVGTVTPKPQEGNPRPRVFRDPAHDAVINRMGFPNGGMHEFKGNFEKFLAKRSKPLGVVGINIGMNKTQTEPAKDYATLIKMLGPMADYLTINISSPNTPGLRDLQRREPLLALLNAVKEERTKACREAPPPVLVKLAPDLDEAQQEELAGALIEAEVDGIILTNTTLDRPDFLPEDFRSQTGGLSGKPLTDKATNVVRNFYRLTQGKIPLIGVGGVSNGAQAYAKIKAGASLVQLYSALIFKGPGVANDINRELLTLMEADGFSHINEAVGADHG